MGMVHTRITGLFVLIATLAGCSSTTTQEIKREPARVRFIEVDTRPVPQANLRGLAPQVASRQGTLDNCHPYARVLAIAALGQPGDRPETGVRVKPDGTVEIGKGVEALVRIGEGEGEKPVVKTPNGGAWSTALTFVSNTTKVPAKGAPLLVVGALLIAGGAAAWWLGAGARIALAMGLAGAALVVVGYVVQNAPWVIWLALAAGVCLVVFQIIDARKGHDRKQAVETVVPVVESLPDILAKQLAEAFPDLNGADVAETANRVAMTVKARIRDGANAGKVGSKVARAIDDAKATLGTATTFRAS